MNMPFIFIDGNVLYSSNGSAMKLSKEDIVSYEENNLSLDEVKSMAYTYLTSVTINDFFYDKYKFNEL